jgi:hypothetical protein
MINTSCGTRHMRKRPFLSISKRYMNQFMMAPITQALKQNGAPFKRYTKWSLIK